jgi:predicted Rossmann-fold nucleotide-binding protein
MAGIALPFSPVRWSIYDPQELFAGYDVHDPASFARTTDFAIYRHFVTTGRGASTDPFVAMMQALHDNSITQATRSLLADTRPAAIMGGHELPRDSPQYRSVAHLARRLCRSGFLVCTGGGPGAMEAGHLGAALATRPDAELEAAISTLAIHPVMPDLVEIVRDDGRVDEGLVEEAHAWQTPAYELARAIPDKAASLAVPTWYYGHEAANPFPTHIAKYFQNSIREEGMLTVAVYGIVFAEGRAGTIQEIFQDAAQNYYRASRMFSPMVLLGADYWTRTYPVDAVLRALLNEQDYAECVRVTDDPDEAAAFIETFPPERLQSVPVPAHR